ncbi:hypothetical protein [Photobacterium sp. GB-50]|uniref:hypothetical protein n=1 Tax=Photobacterium sp. GB-50 TaxID=2022107 RepID=UPI001E3526F7|nr:hypothetical protein [Photobacterium sp. GB-50]
MENIIIRHSEDKDIMGVKAIYESEIAYGGTLQLPFPSLDRWTSRLSNLPQGCYSLVAEYEGEIVGQLLLIWLLLTKTYQLIYDSFLYLKVYLTHYIRC